MEYAEFENRMVHDGKRNNREVQVTCKRCGEKSWQRWQRVKKKFQNGSDFFCSHGCHVEYQRELGSEHTGKENARLNFDKSRNTWYAFWWEGGILRNTTAAKWLWEQNYGEVPYNYVVTYIDRNPENCVLENLEIVTRGERTSEALMGHTVSEEAKKNMSKAHTGKTLSDEHKRHISEANKRSWEQGMYDSVHVGENNHNWRGGVEIIYPREFLRKRKNIVRRDKYKCRLCRCDDRTNLHVHHIDCDPQNSVDSNLITVCVNCHIMIHSKQKDVPVEILAFRSMLNYGDENES